MSPTTCARSAWAGSSAPTSAERPRALRTAFRIGSGAASFPTMPFASCRTSRPPRAACRRSSTAESRTSSTGRSRTRPTGALSSDRPGGCGTSGSTRATASASPPPAAPAGSWPSGSSKASPASTCWGWIRAASAPTPASATSFRRTRRPTATSSPSIFPTRNAPTRDRRRRARCTTASTPAAQSGDSATAGSAPTGSPRRASSAGAAERYDSDYLFKSLPADGLVTLRNITNTRGCFVLAGPRSREVLAQLTDTPLDNASFPWLTAQVIEAGLAVDVYALRVNFVGALGWELHFPIEYAHHLFDALFAAGKAHGIGMVGMRAMESLRLEKSYRMWGSDMTPDYTPFEASLDRFVRMNKGYFIGREALEKQLAAGVPNRFVTLEVHGVTDADPLGNEPLFERGGRMIGRATSGYYGHCLRKSLAIGYARAEYAQPGTQLTIEILGERKQATVLRESPYDPDNLDLRT